MKVRSADSYWLYHTPLLYTYQTLNKNISAEVVVVGTGISGALAAYQLIKAGSKVTIVSNQHAGMASTCASTSLLQYEIDTPLHKLIEKTGQETAELSYLLCKESIDTLEKIHKVVGATGIFKKRKSLLLASHEKDVEDLQKEYKARKKIGLKVKWLDSKKIKKQFGFDAWAAIYSMEAAQTDVYRLTQEIIQWCVQHGATVYDKCEIKEIHHHQRSVELETNDGYIIKAKYAVMATGYEADKWIDKNFARLHSTFVIVSEPFEKEQLWKDECLIWETARPYTYMRTTSDNRVIVGGKDMPFSNTTRRDKLIGAKSKQLLKEFGKKFPKLEFFIEHEWAGTFAETRDGLPFIGTTPHWPRVYFALGYGGNGITFSQIAAEIISDAIHGKKHRAADLFGFGRASA